MTYDDLTDAEREVCARAAQRWGLSNPSFDDVLSTLTPKYASGVWVGNRYETNETPCSDTYAIEFWALLKDYAMTLPMRRPGELDEKSTKPVDEEAAAKIIELYVEGHAIGFIEGMLGITRHRIRRTLIAHGFNIADRRGRKPNCRAPGCPNEVGVGKQRYCSNTCAERVKDDRDAAELRMKRAS